MFSEISDKLVDVELRTSVQRLRRKELRLDCGQA